MNYVIINGELYHHGVKGMKWGVRKAKDKYKAAKKRYASASREKMSGFGIKGIANANRNIKKANSAYVDMATAKAQYKAAKAKNAEKAEKAELKSYVKSMGKIGLPGSNADTQSLGRSKQLYDKLKTEKGKKYADRVAKKVQNRVVANIVATSAVALGSAVVYGLLEARNG